MQWRQTGLQSGVARAAPQGLWTSCATPLFHSPSGKVQKLFLDVWAARDGYISVVLDRSQESIESFLRTHQSHPLSDVERVWALELMEMQTSHAAHVHQLWLVL